MFKRKTWVALWTFFDFGGAFTPRGLLASRGSITILFLALEGSLEKRVGSFVEGPEGLPNKGGRGAYSPRRF